MKSKLVYYILIGISCCILFIPFLGSVHLFDWDEINFAECAREMIVSNNYSLVTINFMPFWEKPPLFIWMQALSMNIFGITEFAARLPNAICGIVTAITLFKIGSKIKSTSFGLLWVLTYTGSFLPHFYFKSGIIDPWFNLFIFLGVYFMAQHTYTVTNENKTKQPTNYIYLSALFIGLGILTKGPVAFLIYSICVITYWTLFRFQKIISLKQAVLGMFIISLVGGFWFILQIASGHSDTVIDFIKYQVRLFNTEDSGHGGPFYYHFIVLLIGCFPASIIAIPSFTQANAYPTFSNHFKKWMIILFAVVLVLFSIVKTKILHYSSLCYFPLTFLAAYSIEKIINGKLKWKTWMTWLICTIGVLIGIVISLPIIIEWNKEKIISSNLIDDIFAIENLKASVHWSGFELLPGLMYIIGIGLIVYLLRNGSYKKAIVGLLGLSLVTVNLVLLLITPKIEKYSQGAAIEFYESLQNKNCYVETLGFKSYAHLFYAQTQPSTTINSHRLDWLLNGPIDKQVFFVSKIDNAAEFTDKYPQLEVLYKKNGFVFMTRRLP